MKRSCARNLDFEGGFYTNAKAGFGIACIPSFLLCYLQVHLPHPENGASVCEARQRSGRGSLGDVGAVSASYSTQECQREDGEIYK